MEPFLFIDEDISRIELFLLKAKTCKGKIARADIDTDELRGVGVTATPDRDDRGKDWHKDSVTAATAEAGSAGKLQKKKKVKKSAVDILKSVGRDIDSWLDNRKKYEEAKKAGLKTAVGSPGKMARTTARQTIIGPRTSVTRTVAGVAPRSQSAIRTVAGGRPGAGAMTMPKTGSSKVKTSGVSDSTSKTKTKINIMGSPPAASGPRVGSTSSGTRSGSSKH